MSLAEQRFAAGRHVLVDAGVALVVAAAGGMNADRVERLTQLTGGEALLVLDAATAARLALRRHARHPHLRGWTGSTVDAVHGRSGPGDAAGVAYTMRIAAAASAGPSDLVRPGHLPTVILDDGHELPMAAGPGAAGLALAAAVVVDAQGRPRSVQEARLAPDLARLPRWPESGRTLELAA